MSSVQSNEFSQILHKIVVDETNGYDTIFDGENTISASTVSTIGEGKCCLLSNYKRHKFCLNLLSYRYYALCYVLIILIQMVALIWDLRNMPIDQRTLSEQPNWFIVLNMICLAMMLIDIGIHIQAFQSLYFRSIINWMDFAFVVLCCALTPIFWFVPGWILQCLLLARFTTRLCRRHTFRKQYVSARNIIVDFKAYENTDELSKYDDLTINQ